MVTLLVIFIIIMGILFLIFVIEISLGPFKIIQSSLADTVVIAGTFLHKGVHESLARTIQGFRFREIHRIPGKRIYKNENSLFNFNPPKKHYLEKINYKLSSAPETSKYITDNNRFIEELSSGCDFLYGSIGDSRVNHGHFVWELNKNDSLNANLTAASNKYKLISILNKNECDANFPLLQFNIVGGGFGGKSTILSPVNLIQMSNFKIANRESIWIEQIKTDEVRHFISLLVTYQLLNRGYISNYSGIDGFTNPVKIENVTKSLIGGGYNSLKNLELSSTEFDKVYNDIVSKSLKIPLDHVKVDPKAQSFKSLFTIKESAPELYIKFLSKNNPSNFDEWLGL